VTVVQLIEELTKLPGDAVVLVDSGSGLSLVSGFDLVPARGPGAPAEVVLLPNMEE
jgi:hypothetical protein